MNDRLEHVVSRLRERFPADADLSEVEAYLSSEGYDRRQIGEIVLAFLTEIGPPRGKESSRRAVAPSSIPFRVVGPHERGRFATDAWGHLLALQSSGMVSATELEVIIDRAMTQLDGRIALEDLRTLMESGGFDELGSSPDHSTIH